MNPLRDVISMSTLGTNGRLGNQIFQYGFLRTYALRHDLEVQTPAWAGQALFGVSDPPIAQPLPVVRENTDHDLVDTIVPHAPQPYRNVDFWGFFQYHTSYYQPERALWRSIFKPQRRVEHLGLALLERLRKPGAKLVGLHIRRGDYGYAHFFRAPCDWYRPWLDAQDKNSVLFVATDEPELVKRELADYSPVVLSDLLPLPTPVPLDYLDFYLLTQCDALAISNSTFSFAAAMLNARASEFMRPVLSQQGLVPFDPWNSMPLLRREKVEDFPAILGISRN